jgi:ribosome biogenesis GTPase A
MSQAKVKATRLKAARANNRAQSTHKLSQQQVLVDQESHNFRLADTITAQGSTILTVFHVKESKFDIDKRINLARLPYQYNPYKRFADTTLYRQVLPIPLRPNWNSYSTREELQQNEVEKFDQYLKVIYDAIPPSRLTHFEHNLDVWRQLWRVCEISDVLCACVDARHPLFHFPPALYDFIVKKLKKPLILILNKIDLVPRPIILAWESFLKKIYPDVHIIKFSSHPNPTPTPPPTQSISNTPDDGNHTSFLTDDSVKLTKGMSVHNNSGGKQTGAGTVHKYQPLGSALLKTFWNVMSFIIERQNALPIVQNWSAENVKLQNSGQPLEKFPTIVTNELVSFALDYSRRIGANDDVIQLVGTNIHQSTTNGQKPRFVYDLGELIIPDSVLITDQMEIDHKLQKAQLKGKVQQSFENFKAQNDNSSDEENITNEVREQLRLLQLASIDDSENDEQKVDKKIHHSKNIYLEDNSDDEAGLETIDTIGNNTDSTHEFKQQQKIALTIGMVGHPNAGKSSLINAILGRPAVSVSNTPGHTKHLQTLTTIPHCSQAIRLCDSPGIVFPAVDISRSLQTLLGIFPYPKLAEPYTCVQFLSERLPLVNIYQLKPYLSHDSDAGLHGSSHPGGDKACFVEGYQEMILKTRYNGHPTQEEIEKRLISIPSNSATNTHAIYLDGIVTSTTPSMAAIVHGENNGDDNTTIVTKSATPVIAAPIIVDGIDIASLAPTSKNNKKKGGKGCIPPQNKLQTEKKTGNELFDTLDQLLVDSRFDQFTNPRFVWSSFRICESYAVKRGWFTESSGKPDTFKAGMSIVKDCVDGKLNLYFLPPRAQANTNSK